MMGIALALLALLVKPGGLDVLSGNSYNNGANLNAASRFHFPTGYALAGGTSDAAWRQWAVPSAGRLNFLRMELLTLGATPTLGTVIATVMVNGVATALTATIAAGAVVGATASNVANSVTVASGDKISLRLSGTDTVVVTVAWSFQYLRTA